MPMHLFISGHRADYNQHQTVFLKISFLVNELTVAFKLDHGFQNDRRQFQYIMALENHMFFLQESEHSLAKQQN